MEENKNNLLDHSKLSFEDLKKIDQEKSCQSEDFQPFLEYSPWNGFEGIVLKAVKLCKKVHHYRSSHLTDFHVLTQVVESEVGSEISKSISDLKAVKELLSKTRWMSCIKKSEKNELLQKPLHELFTHRKKYATFCSCQDHQEKDPRA